MATRRQVKKQENKLNAAKTKGTEAVAKAGQAVEEKAVEVKKAATEKVAEAKKVTAEKATEVKKAATEKVTEVKKTTEKKAEDIKKAAGEAAKTVKKAAPKKEMKTSLVVEYQGRQVTEKDIIAAAKKAWTKSGHKIGEIKTMTLYVKPEENKVYPVINDTEVDGVEI